MNKYLGTGEDEGEVIVEVREVRVALKVLPNLSLIGGRRMRNLLLKEDLFWEDIQVFFFSYLILFN